MGADSVDLTSSSPSRHLLLILAWILPEQAGLRDQVKIIASGRVVTAWALMRTLALGADVCNSARGMMFALGCIQALKCHTNRVGSLPGLGDPTSPALM